MSWIDARIERLETQKMADGIILVWFDRHQHNGAGCLNLKKGAKK